MLWLTVFASPFALIAASWLMVFARHGRRDVADGVCLTICLDRCVVADGVCFRVVADGVLLFHLSQERLGREARETEREREREEVAHACDVLDIRIAR